MTSRRESRWMYCSACDREVEVLAKEDDAPETVPGRPLDRAAFTCLAYGDRCTGSMCPLFDVPPARAHPSRGMRGRQAGS